jgi:hypothetical protein
MVPPVEAPPLEASPPLPGTPPLLAPPEVVPPTPTAAPDPEAPPELVAPPEPTAPPVESVPPEPVTPPEPLVSVADPGPQAPSARQRREEGTARVDFWIFILGSAWLAPPPAAATGVFVALGGADPKLCHRKAGSRWRPASILQSWHVLCIVKWPERGV